MRSLLRLLKKLRLSNRMSTRALVLICLVFALIPPGAALAASYTYANGIYGCCGYFPGPGYGSYLYNQVWHSTNGTWEVYYELTDGSPVGDVQNNSNPTKWPNPIGYGDPWCHNVNDVSGVVWTCQYGQ